MYLLYLIATTPLILGGVFFYTSKKIALIEWVPASVVSYITAGMFHLCLLNGMTHDIQTLSGEIILPKHFSAWLEYYEYAVYRTEYYTETESYTDSNGKSGTRTVTKSREVFDHWEPTQRQHSDEYILYSNINTSYNVNLDDYQRVVSGFGESHNVDGRRTTSEHNSRMISGDKYDYESINKNDVIFPITSTVCWVNKIKVCPSVFSFAPVPSDVKVESWPQNPSAFFSERVMGLAKDAMDVEAWDKMCARLGPLKKVNPIIIGFDGDESIAEWQQASWIGGKKNDLVICYGLPHDKPSWCKVFGWTDSELVKENLTSIILKYGVSPYVIPMIKGEIKENYVIKDWSSFDYLTVEPPVAAFYWLILVLCITQGIAYFCFHNNNEDKEFVVSFMELQRFQFWKN